jgi:FkbM family methyltransferase
MFSIKEIIQDVKPIKIVDVGAMALGDSPSDYHPLVEKGLAEVIGFEPVAAECEKLNNMANEKHRYLPYFIGDGSKRTFHLCNYSMTSSLYEPNSALLKKFQYLDELVQVVETSNVNTKRLDDIQEIGDVDLLKIDIQGAELDAFNGAKKTLKNIVAVHTEVEFVPLYKKQPLFSEVDIKLRENGFLFHKFHGLSGRAFKPLVNLENEAAPLSQLLWSDAIYLRNFMRLDNLSVRKLIALSIITHELYQSYDFCSIVLEALDKKLGNTKYQVEYLGRLTSA